jgi:hypothetical protein
MIFNVIYFQFNYFNYQTNFNFASYFFSGRVKLPRTEKSDRLKILGRFEKWLFHTAPLQWRVFEPCNQKKSFFEPPQVEVASFQFQRSVTAYIIPRTLLKTMRFSPQVWKRKIQIQTFFYWKTIFAVGENIIYLLYYFRRWRKNYWK